MRSRDAPGALAWKRHFHPWHDDSENVIQCEHLVWSSRLEYGVLEFRLSRYNETTAAYGRGPAGAYHRQFAALELL